jgi:hypothetical protein
MSNYLPLNLTAVPDAYTAAATRECPGSKKLIIQVSNAAVDISFGVGIGGVQWGPDEPYLTVTGSIVRDFDAVRVRNHTPGQTAQAILTPITG